ncbi:hypothetical protein [Luteimonas sp. e5]
MSIEDRLRWIEDRTMEEDALIACFAAVEQLVVAIGTDAAEFSVVAKEQRSELRRAIVVRHMREHGMRSYVDTSRRVLFLRFECGRPRLTWHVAWFSRRGPRPRFSSVKSTKSGTALRDVLEGAHPDEMDLLTSHEMTVRDFNARWARIVALRRALRMCALATLNARDKGQQPGNPRGGDVK